VRIGVVIAGATALIAGCGSVAYRVPGIEVQRLAQLDPMSRGDDVRVVPRAAPLSPSTAVAFEPPPPPSIVVPPPPPDPPAFTPAPAPAPAPGAREPDTLPETYDEDLPAPPPAAVDVAVEIDLPVGGRVAPPVRARPIYLTRPAPAPRRMPAVPVVVVSAGGWRGVPVHVAGRSGPPRPIATGGQRGGGLRVGGRHGGGGSGATAAVVGVVAVIGLVAALAIAAEHTQKIAEAHAFDGWVSVEPTHVIHLHYLGNRVRSVPLCDLDPADTVGLRYAVLRAADGIIQRGRPR
jgi:hypothetical protein